MCRLWFCLLYLCGVMLLWFGQSVCSLFSDILILFFFGVMMWLLCMLQWIRCWFLIMNIMLLVCVFCGCSEWQQLLGIVLFRGFFQVVCIWFSVLFRFIGLQLLRCVGLVVGVGMVVGVVMGLVGVEFVVCLQVFMVSIRFRVRMFFSCFMWCFLVDVGQFSVIVVQWLYVGVGLLLLFYLLCLGLVCIVLIFLFM